MQQRLQKIIAQAGLASRRSAEELIAAGRVRVNGQVVTELGAKADAGKDKVEVDGKRLVRDDYVYVAYHKPRNVVSTMSDPEGRPTVAEHLAPLKVRAFPVGRLDFATSGLLLVTNDGEFSNALLHPKRAVPKTYIVKVKGKMERADLDRWRKGVMLEDGMTLPAEVKLDRYEDDKTWFEITITEGRNQQIRRMGEATRFFVMRLSRLSFAGISSEGLRPGELRTLTREELRVIKEKFGVPKRLSAGGVDPLAPTKRGRPIRTTEELPRVTRGRDRRTDVRDSHDRGAHGKYDEGGRGSGRHGARPQRDHAERGQQSDRRENARERTPARSTDARRSERPRTERPQTERTRTERPQTERPRTERPQTERTRTERPRTERPRIEKPQTDRGDARSARSDRFGKKPRGAG
jgi:23S rRNA pseudouridine2605 synthase